VHVKAGADKPARSCARAVCVGRLESARLTLAGGEAGNDAFRVTGAYPTGSQALRRISAVRADLVLLAERLPDMPGLACVGRLKRIAPRLRVLLVGETEVAEAVVNGLAAGADGWVWQHAPAAELGRAVRAVLAGGIFVPDAALRGVVELCLRDRVLHVEGVALTRREQQVLGLVVSGASDKEIAE